MRARDAAIGTSFGSDSRVAVRWRVCAFEQDYYRGLFPLPWACILLELDEGPLFVSNLVSPEAGEPCLDMPVRVTFLDCEDDAGSFKLPLFRPDASISA
jgi:hypothetical protein